MNEQEWLTSTDPQAMLRYIFPLTDADVGLAKQFRPSDRKLRLFACAVERHRMNQYAQPRIAWASRWDSLEHAEDGGERRDGDNDNFWLLPAHAARLMALPNADNLSPQEIKANLLRDIFGNPYRPVAHWIEVERVAGGKLQQDAILRVCGPGHTHIQQSGIHPDWLTWHDGIVVKLAQAAYDERQKGCPRCDYTGKLTNPLLPRGWQYCPHCQASDTGTLDAGRLAVIADALEESGCEDEVILRHLRGWERCGCSPHGPDGFRSRTAKGAAGQTLTVTPCELCLLTGWVKSDSPHVRGCWAIDLILGKE